MSTVGAIIGLLLAVLLIIKRIPIAYSLILGAVAGGLLGGLSLVGSVSVMIDGVKDITPAIIRILTAGVLSGVLIKTGAAESISNTIVRKLGEKYVYMALALSALLLCAIGVFIDVTIITVAPIALQIHSKCGIPIGKLLVVMVGGGKCGNIISPNPNTIIAVENFNTELYSTMCANLIPALIGLIFTIFIVVRIFPGEKRQGFNDGTPVTFDRLEPDKKLPSFGTSIIGPVVTVVLLALRPLCGVTIDPLIALPAGGLVGILFMRRMSMFRESMEYGLSKMASVAILLVGTGTIAGIIKASSMKDVIIDMLSKSPLSEVFIAPISGALMSAATASSTAGATIASSSFAPTILATGVAAVWGAAMVNSGATVLDHLPHGSFFHATGGSMDMTFKDRLRLIPYETLVGLVLALSTVGTYELSKLLF
ncbi:GntP family permease [Bacteroides sp.]